MTIAPITAQEIGNVTVTREGSTLRATTDLLKVTANMSDDPATLRTRATMVLALATYIDSPPAPPFEFPQNHAAVLLADGPMQDGVAPVARFTRIEDRGWFSATYGWQTEAFLLKDFTNLRVISEGIPGTAPDTIPDPTE
ncbi:hypothetical protein HYP71_gp070 [Arthrobacter phage KBurrousTX]|uniref:Uncharacterized protein n=1 Tax=Arthrobacter phage KBurrousTX TaxID=2315608 RepID=A0A386KB58_9CAUD|nr:hypothetical protein HYP71_gp070 [Arthrobacter phage KBurrousTX]AYD81564.1 hypothetical protein KBurrousTX_70 [Arthrobacter phage KBurrousTX]